MQFYAHQVRQKASQQNYIRIIIYIGPGWWVAGYASLQAAVDPKT